MRAAAIIAAELQGVMRNATILLGELLEAQSAPQQEGVNIDAAHRQPCSRAKYTLNGKPMLVKQLADVAGCTLKAMEQRLWRGMTPEEAVAAGAALRRSGCKADPVAAAEPAPAPVAKPASKPRDIPSSSARLYQLDDKQVTLKDLAALAGCSTQTMYARLANRSPAQAVAMGGPSPTMRNHFSMPVRQPSSAAPIAAAHAERQAAAFAPDTPVFVPPDLVPEVRKTPPGRYDVENPPRLFSGMRPGQYEDTGSAIERYYKDKESRA